jgi:hypothetical protein
MNAVAGMLVAIILAAACACGDNSNRLVITVPTPPGAPGLPVSRELPPGATDETIKALILRDAADRSGLPLSGDAVAAYCRVTWPDGSTGVARPGAVYTQAQVRGWLAIVRAGAEEYRYHGTATGFIAASFVLDATIDESLRC